MKDSPKLRFIIIIFMLFAVVLGFIVKLYFMQIVNGDEYASKTVITIPHTYTVEAVRGDIYDRNGVLLAYNTESFNLYLSKSYKVTAELNQALLTLMTILQDNKETYVNNLEKYYDFENRQFNADLTEDELDHWLTDEDLFNMKSDKLTKDPTEFFTYMRNFFLIDDEYTDFEAYKIMILRYEILKNRWYWLSGESLLISKNISERTLAEVSEQKHIIQGIVIRPSTSREYGDVTYIAHVLGYVGMVSPEDVTEKGYQADSVIGKTGVEDYAEELLKGTDGYEDVITDLSGNVLSNEGGEPAVEGNDLYLTINMNLQKVAMESLVNNIEIIKEKATPDDKRNHADASAGSAVVLDVNTGEVIVMTNYPTYDPSWFIHNDEISKQKRLEVLLGSSETSMFNRAMEGLYTPGSTFKPIVAVAGLEEKVITKDTLIFDPGHKVIGDWDFYCLEYVMYGYTHGYLDVIEAIKTSCNMFFYILGTDTKIDAIDKWAELFGLGKKTGIDLYSESRGIRSNPDYKYGKEFEKWYTADTAQSSIGQLYHNYTPLQLAVYTAALANGGKVLTPYVIKEAISKDGESVYEGETKYSQVPWSQETFETIRTAMASVVQDGTAEKVFGDSYPIKVAGKTGTAETGREANESSNAVFICYAPIENPQIAIAVVIEHGVWGSYAAPVAKDILNEYFGLNYTH